MTLFVIRYSIMLWSMAGPRLRKWHGKCSCTKWGIGAIVTLTHSRWYTIYTHTHFLCAHLPIFIHTSILQWMLLLALISYAYKHYQHIHVTCYWAHIEYQSITFFSVLCAIRAHIFFFCDSSLSATMTRFFFIALNMLSICEREKSFAC